MTIVTTPPPSRGVTFGEALFRFSTLRGERIRTSQLLEFYLGGTELNIAANLQALGHRCDWVSVVPEGLVGDLILDRISDTGVRAQVVKAKGDAGWYLLETGATPRSDVVLSRTASLMSKQLKFDFDWTEILTGAKFFHTSGITAGLSLETTNEVERALSHAKKLGLETSYDFNFRKNIWTLEESVNRQKAILGHIDVLFCAQTDLEQHFGWSQTRDPKFKEIFAQTKIKTLVMSRRAQNDSSYSVDVVNPNGAATATQAVNTLDRIGMGDAMAAGFWAARLNGLDDQAAAEWAAASGALKATVKGDMALLSPSEITSLIANGYKGVLR